MKELKCDINFKRGWKCIRSTHIDGPCALIPRWWNIIDRIRFRRNL